MKIIYDPETDLMAIDFNDKAAFVTDSDSIPGLSILYDEDGKVCGIELLDSSEIVSQPRKVDFEVQEADVQAEDVDAQRKLA